MAEHSEERRLEGRVALVTGASRGLGEAIALELAGHGAQVLINYRQSDEAARALQARIESQGGHAETYQADVTRPEEVERMFRDVHARHKRVDILVNNAGTTRDEYFPMMRDSSWEELVALHLDATFLCCKAVLRGMCAARRGVIINMGSLSGLLAVAGQVNYSASKAGLLAFSRSLARELAGKGVRVVHLAPGFFETEMTRLVPPARRERALQRTPMARWGRPEELAELVAFLASDEASFLTGHTLPIDGGRYAADADFALD
jgi:3-oxoacyl-[acyl-carrier protein] reductase